MVYEGEEGESHETFACNYRLTLLDLYQSALHASDAESQLDWKCPECKAVMDSGTSLVEHFRSVHRDLSLRHLSQSACVRSPVPAPAPGDPGNTRARSSRKGYVWAKKHPSAPLVGGVLNDEKRSLPSLASLSGLGPPSGPSPRPAPSRSPPSLSLSPSSHQPRGSRSSPRLRERKEPNGGGAVVLRCPLCLYGSKRAVDVAKHIRVTHPDDILSASQCEEVQLVRCSKCYKPWIKLQGHECICRGPDMGGMRDPPPFPEFTEHPLRLDRKDGAVVIRENVLGEIMER